MKIYTGWRRSITIREAVAVMQPTSVDCKRLSDMMPVDGDSRVTLFAGHVHLRYQDEVKFVKFPKNYRFEASIPPIFRWWLGKPTDLKLAHAALVHDVLYSNGYRRDIADAMFYYRLRKDGVGFINASAMYLGVRLGGHALYAAKTSKFWKFVANMMGFKR